MSKAFFVSIFCSWLLCTTFCLADDLPEKIKVKCIVLPRYEKYFKGSFFDLMPYLEKKGLRFVRRDPDVYFCNSIDSNLLATNKPIIILEPHTTRLKYSTIRALRHSQVKAVFKNLILRPRELYYNNTCVGQYNFKLINNYAHLMPEAPSKLRSIPRAFLRKIHCVPWDIHLTNFTLRLKELKNTKINFNRKRDIDVFFAGYTFFERASVNYNLFYSWHRKRAIEAIKGLEGLQIVAVSGRPFTFQEYISKIKNSKIVVSPWGLSEWCFRDVEAMLCGAVLIKPDSHFIKVIPDIYVNNSTYVPCKPDFSDLSEQVSKIINNYDEYKTMRMQARDLLLSNTSLEQLAEHFVKKVRDALAS